MNKEKEVIKKLNEYSSECHTQLAYSINGYKKKHPGDLRLCMYETDVILNYIKYLQHQLEEKDKIIKDLQLDSFIFLKNRINQGMSKENMEKHLIRIGKNIIDNLERGKNEKKKKIDILEELINEEIESYLKSGFKVTDEYVVDLRKLLKHFNLKEKYDFDRWLDE